MTIPLLVDAKGEKFGKSTGGGALWLDPAKTSPCQLYQYLLNVQDGEVEDLLYRQTFKPQEEITQIMADHERSPEKRIGQKFLAGAIVELVHGQSACEQVER